VSAHPKIQAHFDEIREDGGTPYLPATLDENAPDLYAVKNGKGYLIRVDTRENETEGFPRTPGQEEWDGRFAAPVYAYHEVQDAVALVNSLQPAPEPEPEPDPDPIPTPTATKIRVQAQPQATRPRFHMPQAGDMTWDKIVTNGTYDRVTMVKHALMGGALSMKALVKKPDRHSNGCRSSIGPTTQNPNSYKKWMYAMVGCRTRHTWKTVFPSDGLPNDAYDGMGQNNPWMLWWQWHQASDGPNPPYEGSPPVALNLHIHPTTKIPYISCRVQGGWYDGQGQYNQIGQATNGNKWVITPVFDTVYDFDLEVFHHNAPVTAPLGWVTLKVNSVTVVDHFMCQTLQSTDTYNHMDFGIYQNPNIRTGVDRWIFHSQMTHLLIPGPNNPLFPYYTPP
jgi:hypothetical protein